MSATTPIFECGKFGETIRCKDQAGQIQTIDCIAPLDPNQMYYLYKCHLTQENTFINCEMISSNISGDQIRESKTPYQPLHVCQIKLNQISKNLMELIKQRQQRLLTYQERNRVEYYLLLLREHLIKKYQDEKRENQLIRQVKANKIDPNEVAKELGLTELADLLQLDEIKNFQGTFDQWILHEQEQKDILEKNQTAGGDNLKGYQKAKQQFDQIKAGKEVTPEQVKLLDDLDQFISNFYRVAEQIKRDQSREDREATIARMAKGDPELDEMLTGEALSKPLPKPSITEDQLSEETIKARRTRAEQICPKLIKSFNDLKETIENPRPEKPESLGEIYAKSYLLLFSLYEYYKFNYNQEFARICYQITPEKIAKLAEIIEEKYPQANKDIKYYKANFHYTFIYRKFQIEDEKDPNLEINNLSTYIRSNSKRVLFERQHLSDPNPTAVSLIDKVFFEYMIGLIRSDYLEYLRGGKRGYPVIQRKQDLRKTTNEYLENHTENLTKMTDEETNLLKFMFHLLSYSSYHQITACLRDDKYFNKNVNLRKMDSAIFNLARSNSIRGNAKKAMIFLLKRAKEDESDQITCLFAQQWDLEKKEMLDIDEIYVYEVAQKRKHDLTNEISRWKKHMDSRYFEEYQAFVPKRGLNRPYCKNKRLLIVFLTLRGFWGESGHQNMLIIDLKNRSAERFEPNGPSFLYSYDQTRKIDKFLERYLKDEFGADFQYQGPNEVCPYIRHGVQSKQKHIGKGGFCVVWSTYYAYFRMLNPDIDPKIANQAMLYKDWEAGEKYSDEELLDLITKFLSYIEMVASDELIKNVEKVDTCPENTEKAIKAELNSYQEQLESATKKGIRLRGILEAIKDIQKSVQLDDCDQEIRDQVQLVEKLDQENLKIAQLCLETMNRLKDLNQQILEATYLRKRVTGVEEAMSQILSGTEECSAKIKQLQDLVYQSLNINRSLFR